MRPQQDGDDNSAAQAQVPIEVLPGYPQVLASLEFPDDWDRQLILARYRRLIEEAMRYSEKLRLVETEQFLRLAG